MIQETTNTARKEIHSRATIAGHPIHPMLIVFPLAFLVGTLATDVIFLFTGDEFWARGSFWLIIAAVVTGVFAALFGLVDFALNARIRRLRVAWLHGGGNAIVLTLAAFSVILRADDPVEAALPWGLILSFVITVLLVVTGWYGGELVYKHGVGVDTSA